MPTSKIFRSRWSALIWAGGILWTAYDVANAAPTGKAASTNQSAPAQSASATTDATGEAVEKDDLSVLANAMGN